VRTLNLNTRDCHTAQLVAIFALSGVEKGNAVQSVDTSVFDVYLGGNLAQQRNLVPVDHLKFLPPNREEKRLLATPVG
jgi:hypothetical protein